MCLWLGCTRPTNQGAGFIEEHDKEPRNSGDCNFNFC